MSISFRKLVSKIKAKPILSAAIGVAVVIVLVGVFLMVHNSGKQTTDKADVTTNSSTSKKKTVSSTDKTASDAAKGAAPVNKSATASPTKTITQPPACGGATDTCTAPFSVSVAGECNGSATTTCVLHNVPTQNKFADFPPSSTAGFYGSKTSNGSTYFTYAVSCSLVQCGQESGGPISGQNFTTSATGDHITVDFTSGTSSYEDVTMQTGASYVYTDTSVSPNIHTVKHFKNWVVNSNTSINFSVFSIYPAYSSVCSYADGQPACSS